MSAVSKAAHDEAVRLENELSRFVHRLQTLSVTLIYARRWTNTLRKENEGRADVADIDDCCSRLCADVELMYESSRSLLLKAREESAKPVSTKV
jgi:hypothetical protein